MTNFGLLIRVSFAQQLIAAVMRPPRSRRVFALCLLIASSIPSHAGEDRTLQPAILDIANRTRVLLKEDGKCTSEPDCISKKLVFVSLSNDGIGVQLWAHKSDELLGRILSEYGALFLARKEIGGIAIDVFAVSKEEDLKAPFWRPSKPIMTFSLKREI